MRDEYISRINRVIDYIQNHLDEKFSFEELASIANFSRFHFHRIFAAMMAETPQNYIRRIRVEKAACLLLANKKTSVTEIAFDCGFSGSATFARAFKDAYNMSATEWRVGGYLKHSKYRKTDSKECKTDGNKGKAYEIISGYIDSNTSIHNWRITMKEGKELQLKNDLQFTVEVKDMPEIDIVYLRHFGPYAGDQALFDRLFKELFTWAGPRELLNFPETKVISMYHDNPDLTDDDKIRLDVCLSVPENTKADGKFVKSSIPAGKYAIAHFEISSHEYPQAWQGLYGGWLPESGYQPDDGPCYENYLNEPKDHPEGKCIVEICIPVKPM